MGIGRTWLRGCALLLAVAVLASPAYGQELEERKTKRIDKALPSEAPVTPKSPRKVLVYTRAAGFVHSSIPYGAYAVEQLGIKTGAFESVVSNNPEVFAPESLAQFDGIILVSTTTRLFEGDEYKESLLNFVKSGKGLIGIHAATDCFYDWAEYGEMIGGYFDGHPWGSGSTVTVKIDDPAHPINAPFAGKEFDVTDEIYQFKPIPYSRDTHRVLLSLSTAADAKTEMDKKGIKREDKDFAVAWVKSFGEGRVFYCSLGHNDHIYWNEDVLAHYLAGIQYALGDLEADATPSAKLDQAYLDGGKQDALAKGLEDTFAAIGSFDYADDGKAAAALEGYVEDAQNDPTLAGALRPRLTALLTSTTATPSAQWLAAKHLNRIGDASSVEAVTPLLSDPERSAMARYALQRMESPEARQAIVGAIGKTDGAARIGLLNAVGQLQLEDAVLAVSSVLTQAEDVDTVAAAANALGRIGTPAAARTLNAARPKAAHPAVRIALTDALLASADSLAASGGTDAAVAIYSALSEESEPMHIRGAALQGLARSGDAAGTAAVIEALKSDNPALARVAISAAGLIDNTDALRELSNNLSAMPASTEAIVIGLLGAQGNAATNVGIKNAIASEHDVVRHAAIRGMGKLGGQMAYRTLTPLALRDDADGAVARETLTSLPGRKVGRQLADEIKAGDSAVRKAYIPVIVARREAQSGDALIAAMADSDASVRSAALDALATLNKHEAFPEVLALLMKEEDEGVRKTAGTTLTVLAKQMEAGQATRHVIAALELDATDATAPALYNVLGRLGGEQALNTVRSGLTAESPVRRDAALRAMAQWPTPEPMMDLLALAESSEDATHRTLAYRGFLDQAAKPNGQAASEKLSVYEKALSIAPNDEDHKRALAALGNVRDVRVFDVVKPYMEREGFEATAKFVLDALANVQPTLMASHGDNSTKFAIDGNPGTRWSTGTPMVNGMWFVVDLGWQKTVTGLTLDTTGSGNDYPRGYEVYLHDVEDAWGTPVASGKGEGAVLTLEFPPTPCRFVRIVQTGKAEGNFWSIHELTLDTQE